jgi:hypothetical protein
MSKDYLAFDETYLEARKGLVKVERNLGFTATTQLTNLEQKASLIVEKIKDWEKTNLHTIYDDGSVFGAADKCLHGFETIQKSNVLKIARKALNGALLRCHLEAMLRPHERHLRDAENQKHL